MTTAITNIQNELPAAVMYLRMSGRKQDTSIPQQREQLTKWADGKYRIIREYVDHARSASKDTDKRIEFLKMVEDAEQLADFEAIICVDNSRFTRETYEMAPVKLRLMTAGVYLDTMLDGRSDWESDTGQIVDAVHAVKNAAFSKLLSQKSLKGRIEATKRGKPSGIIPYALHKLVTDDRGEQRIYTRHEKSKTIKDWTYTYIPGDQEEVKIVRWLFAQYAKRDTSFRQLATEMNRKGIPASRGGLWCDRTIRLILNNRCYVGDVQFGKSASKGAFHVCNGEDAMKVTGKTKRAIKRKPIDQTIIHQNAFAGIIPRKLFDAVQTKISRNVAKGYRPHRDAGYPLTGILRCGHCGGNMVAKAKRIGFAPIYICKRANQNPGCGCECWSVRQDDILPMVLNQLRQNMDDTQLRMMTAGPSDSPQEDTTAAARKQLAEVERQIERGTRRLLTVPDSVADRLAGELSRLNQLREQLKASLDAPEDRDACREFFQWWESNKAKLVYLPDDKPVQGRMVKAQIGGEDHELFVGDTTEDSPTPIEPTIIRETLKSMNAQVSLNWTEQKDGRRRWKLDQGRIRVSMDRFTLRTSGARG